MILDIAAYLKKERVTWDALDAQCKRLEDDAFCRLSVEEVEGFYLLYRRTAAALAVLQESYADVTHIRVLEQLVGRAYGIIYGRGVSGRKVRWISWFFRDFPRVFRKHFAAFGLSLLVTVLGCGLGAFLIHSDPTLKEGILPFGHGQMDPAKRVADEESGGKNTVQGRKGTFSAFLIQNNISVSLRAIAFGLSFGIGTLLLMLYNGVILGAICLDYIAAGKSMFLAGWLLPHGSIEIPAILIAGQAGFLIAGAMIGNRAGGLRVRMKSVGADVAVLTGGIAVMLVWAGFVESFFSQYHQPVLPYTVKMTFGALELAALAAFLAFGGKRERGNGR